MHKGILLSLLLIGFVSVAAVPNARADFSDCMTFSKDSNRGSFTADFCIDAVSDIVQVSGTATLNNGQQLSFSGSGSIACTIGHGGSAAWDFDGDFVLTDSSGASVIRSKSVSVSGNSFSSLLQKLTSKLSNLIF